ncbi:hypothetical protein B7494_g8399 [Chlorociboria aeruginascens]|nr:hypothetical protein B7494_g8399 [Chlorociboria aeruginascens]
MADSLCGPSNALQNFQKHTAVDRTLQQDRLINRATPSQGFRSSPSSSAGHLENEFNSFQAGHSPLELPGFHPQHPSHTPPNFQQPNPSWASDFQQMNLSSTSQLQQLSRPQSQQSLDIGGWHHDFARQHGQVAEQSISQLPGQTPPSYRNPRLYKYGTIVTPQFSGGYQASYEGKFPMAQQQQQPEVFDEEAFARAFEEASKIQMDEVQETKQEGIELGQEIPLNEQAERFLESEANLERLGADLILDPSEERQSGETRDDSDALAQTAGLLLDSVKDNQSSKFQNSQFLELMRQLRDREIAVEGDNLVERNSPALNDEVKEELIALSTHLKNTVFTHPRNLTGKHALMAASERVHDILGALLRFNRLYMKVDASTIHSARIIRLLISFTCHPDIILLPTVLSLSQFAYMNFCTIAYPPSEPWSGPEADEIRNASKDIESLSDDRLNLQSYIISALEKGPYDPKLMCQVLGYTVRPEKLTHESLHIRRVRDILGPAVCDVMDICIDRGLFTTSLGVERFFELVDARDKEGGTDTAGFKRSLRDLEHRIEDGRMREWYNSYAEGRARLEEQWKGHAKVGDGEGEVTGEDNLALLFQRRYQEFVRKRMLWREQNRGLLRRLLLAPNEEQDKRVRELEELIDVAIKASGNGARTCSKLLKCLEGQYNKAFILTMDSSIIDLLNIDMIPNFDIERQWISVQTLRDMWKLLSSSWPDVIELEDLKFIQQSHEAISLVQISQKHRSKLFVFKSVLRDVECLYHELKLPLKLEPHTHYRAITLHCGKEILIWRQDRSMRFHSAVPLLWDLQNALHCNISKRRPDIRFYSNLKLIDVVMSGDLNAILIDFEQRSRSFSWSAPEIHYIHYLEHLATFNSSSTIRARYARYARYASMLQSYIPSWKPLDSKFHYCDSEKDIHSHG